MTTVKLKWVKTTNGYYAESRFGNYAAERTAGGKFVCRLDGVDEYGNKPTTLAQVKEICQTLDDDRSGRVASAGPQPSSSPGPAPVEAPKPTPVVVLSPRSEVPAGGQHGGSPVDGDGRNMTADRIAAAEATWEPAPTPAPSGLVARLSQPRPVDTAPHLLVEARAGTGKTTTLVGALKVLKGIDPGITPSPQQKAVWDSVALSAGVAKTACFVAFNKSIAEELKARVPQGCDAMTLHGMGFRAVRNAFPRVRVEQYRVSNIIGEVLGRDVRELRRTKAALIRVVEELVGLCKMNLADPTPEALLDLVSYYEIDTEGASVDEAFALVPRVIDRCKDVAADGCIDFDDMVWLPVALGLPVYRYDLLMVDEAQDLNRCQQALTKVAGSRLVLCGDPKQCHPAGTMVTKTGGEVVPIETLRVGDQLVSLNPNQGRLVGTRAQGRAVEMVASRDYAGPLYTVNGTRCTPNHKWPTRFNEECKNWTALYLMELSDGSFRIGVTQLMMVGSNGFGPGLRARQEGGVKVWLLDVFEDRGQAREQEFKNSMRYRVPQRAQYEEAGDDWPRHLMDEGAGPDVDGLLSRYGRVYEFPVWEQDDVQHVGTKRVWVTQTCNLIPKVNVIARRFGDTDEVRWLPLSLGVEADWVGRVYSLQVQPTEKDRRLYLANGNVTSNSIYGFAGADAQSMKRLEDELIQTPRGCRHLPLTVTRRCGKAIVKEANRIVPDFEAHETNGEGAISRHTMKTYAPVAADGDMVLCRVNAPLVSECFKFIRAGRKANILGRDIGQGLISTVTKLKAATVAELIGKLGDWLDAETRKENAKKNPSEARIIGLQDRHDCLLCFTEGLSATESPTAVVRKIEFVFTDDKTKPGIRLSSIHKSKGLEAKRVFLLEPEGATVPHPMAKSAWQREQEGHLLYVAITRAIEELVYVS